MDWLAKLLGRLPEGGLTAENVFAARDVVGAKIEIHADGSRLDPENAQMLAESYLRRVMDLSGRLALSGIDLRAATQSQDGAMRLDAVYTALLTTSPDEETHKRQGPEPETRFASALEQLERRQRLLLLGEPGSGKSTFCNFVALCLAGELLGAERANLALLTEPLPAEGTEKKKKKQPWSHGALLPVPIVLRDFAARGLPPVGEQTSAQHLRSFLEAELSAAALADFAPLLEATLRRGGALVLLDGLDEVPAAEGRRQQLLDAIGDFAATFGACRYLVTCRTYAYREQKWQLPGFGGVVLAELSDPQVRCFVDRWYGHVAELEHRDCEHAQGSAKGLKRAIFASDRLQALARRPLLLTLMASLHAWHGGTLPEKREELYAAAVELLLHTWEQRRMIKDKAQQPILLQPSLAEWLQVDRDEVRQLLDRLAFEAHAAQPKLEGTADIAEKDLVAGLLEVAKNPDARPARLVEFLRDRAGLLVARGVGVYTFPHRTFQEYLAACHLTDCDFPEKVAELARGDAERWREVALLAGAKAARGSASSVWLLAKELCDEEPAQGEKRLEDARGAQLAGVLLAESGDLKRLSEKQRKTLDRARRWQLALMRGSELPARERAECGRSVAVLGDPRPEVLTTEAMEFCRVPAGPFWMGSEASDPLSYDDERPAGVYELDYDYEIGRFPVTQAQYQEFVEAGGYREARFWADTRFDRGEGPKTFGGSFGLANHPVVGVSWFEAVAYCQWLTERLSAFGRLEPGWYSRLPNEPEWEKAARGGLGIAGNQRRYPWGEAPNAEFCNFLETGIILSNAVGCFKAGASPWGCEDLSGNVWEWTRSQWGMETEEPVFGYPYRPDDGREVIDSPNVRCVLRGGAFHYNENKIRCSVRNRLKLFSRSIDVGFRVVLSPF